MTISYPLSCPVQVQKQSSITWIELNNVVKTLSPFALVEQVQDMGAAKWRIEVSIDPLTRAEAQPWIAFLSALHGPKGTFLFGDEIFKSPINGIPTGTPLVKGANQSGDTLITDGWANSTLVLKAGDMFSVSNRIYRALLDVTSNGSGEATIDIWPRAKLPADNAPLVLSGWSGLFRLIDQDIATMTIQRSQLVTISFSAEEAF
jgi:hypothetical protein